MNLDAELEDIRERFMMKPVTQLTEFELNQVVTNVVRRFYDEGSWLVDDDGQPILTFEEVEIIIGRHEHRGAYSMSVCAVRRHTMEKAQMITREMFIAATGREPVLDDLDRVNCPHAGEAGHFSCGWNEEHDKPQMDIGPVIPRCT